MSNRTNHAQHAAFLQNARMFCDVLPRALLWAGMRRPVGAGVHVSLGADMRRTVGALTQ
jgi:hypothetical protein